MDEAPAYPTRRQRVAARVRSKPGAEARVLGFTWRQHAAALAILAAVTLAFFFPLLQGETLSNVERRQREIYPWAALQTGGNEPVIHYDIAESFYPWQIHMSRAVKGGELPLWDPHSFGGHPFFTSGTNGPLYPPRVALSLTVSPQRARDVLIVSHFFLAGVAMFALLGVVRLSFPAALVGALAWMTNSYALAWQYLEHYAAIEVWLPVGVLLAHLAVRRRSWPAAFALALALGVMLFGGNALYVELALLAIFGYGATLAVVDAVRDRSSLGGNAARLGTSAVLFLGLTAVTSLTTLALAEGSARTTPTYELLELLSLPFSALAHLFFPPDDWVVEPYHQNLFAGTAVGVLAIIGIGRRNALAAFSAVLGVLTILYMLHTPVTRVAVEVLPGMDDFKPLARAAFLVQFALAVLAAFGLQTVLGIVRRPNGGHAALRWLPAALVTVVAVSIVGQMYRVSDDLVIHQPNEERLLLPEMPLIRFLKDAPDGRMMGVGRTMIRTIPAFPGLTGMAHRLDSAGGYYSVPPERTYFFWRVLSTGKTREEIEEIPLTFAFYQRYQWAELRPEVLARAGVRYVVTPFGLAGPGPYPDGLERVYGGRDGDVFTVRDAVPRAYLAGGCAVVSDSSAALELFMAGAIDPRGAVILERDFERPASHRCGGSSGQEVGSASVVDESLNSLEVRIRADRDAWLVVTDTWDEGWSATVDGEDTDVLPGNYAQRAVAVPAGEHLVRLEYEPVHFRAGVALSALSLAVTLGGLVWLAVRRRRARS